MPERIIKRVGAYEIIRSDLYKGYYLVSDGRGTFGFRTLDEAIAWCKEQTEYDEFELMYTAFD